MQIRKQVNAYLSLPNLRVKATSSLPSTLSIYMASIYWETVGLALSNLPNATLLERGHEFRLLGLSGSLLLVFELFGQLLGQSQVGCMRTISARMEIRATQLT